MKEAGTKVIDTIELPWSLNGRTSALQPEEITFEFHVCTINKSAHTKKSLETYLMILVYIYI